MPARRSSATIRAMRKIVLGYDGSAAARRALERVAELGAGNGCAVTLVGAAPIHFSSLGPLPPGEAELAEQRRALAEAHASLEEAGVRARVDLEWGDPAEIIVDVAAKEEADLIVVGTHGKNVVKRLALGSVSTKVLHEAPCDVLVVR